MIDILKEINYELMMAEEIFDNNNGGLNYGITWLDEYGNALDCEWFGTEENRQYELKKTAFMTICQEEWENNHHSTQLDDNFILSLLKRLEI